MTTGMLPPGMGRCVVTGKVVPEDELVEINGQRVCAEGKAILLEQLKTGDAAPGLTSLSMTGRAIEMLRQTKPWVRFISVMTFIGAGFMLLAGLIIIVVGSLVPGGAGAGTPAFLGLIYIPMALLYIAPGIFLWRYATHINNLLARGTSQDLEAALGAQKSFWKYVGILMLVILCFYVVILAFALIAGVFAATMHR